MSRSVSPTLVSKYMLSLPSKKILEDKVKEIKNIFEKEKIK